VTHEFQDTTSGLTVSAVSSRGNAVPTLFNGKTVTGSLSAAGAWGIGCAAVNAGTGNLSVTLSVVDDSGATVCSAMGSSRAGDTAWIYCSPTFQTTGRCTAQSNNDSNTKLLVLSGTALGNDFASGAVLTGVGL
jgi:hypothetical protein